MATVPWSVQSGGQTTANLYTDVAYAGLKADLTYDLVTTLIYKQTDVITPGLVLCQLSDDSGALPSVAYAANTTLAPVGVFVKDATLNMAPDPSFWPPSAPATAQALSMLQRGRIWAQVTASGTCTLNGPVHFSNDGTVSDGGPYVLQHAVFKSAATNLQEAGGTIAVIELQSPMAS